MSGRYEAMARKFTQRLDDLESAKATLTGEHGQLES